MSWHLKKERERMQKEIEAKVAAEKAEVEKYEVEYRLKIHHSPFQYNILLTVLNYSSLYRPESRWLQLELTTSLKFSLCI